MRPLPWGYAMLMSPNEDETAVHVCHCLGDMVVRMRKVLGPYRRVDTCATGLLKTCSVLCCRWYGSTYAWCPFGQDVRVTHGGLTSLNLRVHSIMHYSSHSSASANNSLL